MGPLDKITYHVVSAVLADTETCVAIAQTSFFASRMQGKAVMSHRYSRLAFVIYALVLHLLVFLVSRLVNPAPLPLLLGHVHTASRSTLSVYPIDRCSIDFPIRTSRRGNLQKCATPSCRTSLASDRTSSTSMCLSSRVWLLQPVWLRSF